MLRTSLSLLAVLVTLSAHATNWYVATNGSNSNAGTLAAPFATISHTENVIQPGDTVYVRGGVYFQRVSLWTSGTSTARITYRPYENERVILDATGLTNSNGTPANGVSLGGHYVDWIGFEIRNAPGIGLVNWGAHDQRLLDNVIYNSTRGGIWIGESSFGLVYNVLISGNRIYNNVLENKGRTWTSGWAQSIGVSHANNVTVTNNVVYRNYGEGIVISRTDNTLVANNEVFDNYSCQIYVSHAQSTVVDSNLVYTTLDKNYYRSSTATHPPHGIVLANEYGSGSLTNATNGNDIINNVVLRTEWGLGFWKDPAETAVHSMTNCRFANNTVYGSTRYALKFEADTNHSGVIVENNIFALPTGSTATLASVPSSAPGITYRYNNWSANPGSPVYSSTTDEIGDPLFALAGGSNAEDYRLTTNSPGKNQGNTLTYVTKDYWLKPRSGTWDMGAHEY